MSAGFFTPAVRARVVAFILQRKWFVEHDSEHEALMDFGIDKLLADKTYLASYAPHEVSLAGFEPRSAGGWWVAHCCRII